MREQIGRVGVAKWAVLAWALTVCGVLTPATRVLAQDIPPTPAGWTKTSDKATNAVAFTPPGIKAGELLAVKFYERQLLEVTAIGVWLDAQLSERAAPVGKWTGPAKVEKQTSNLATGTRSFKTDAGKEGAVFCTAVCVDGQSARLAAMVFTTGDAFAKHKGEAQQLITGLMAIEKAAAERDERGLKIEAAPPKVKGIAAGGPIKPGRYVGNMISSNDNKVLRAVEILIFDNGEYEFTKGGPTYPDTGTYDYSPATGRFQADDPLENSTYEPGEDFCIFGKGDDGKPTIYAEDFYGLGTHVTRLRWAGEVGRPPPTEAARLKKEAEEEAARYKWVTAPGEGVKPDEIECVLYCWDQRFVGTMLQMEEFAYLLMKDGRVLDGLPVPPQDLDLAASRSRDPDKWGWWKKQDDSYLFAWPARPNDYTPPRGHPMVARPIPAGTKLVGTYDAASSWGTIGGMGGANFWGLNLSEKGRFQKWKRGIAGTGMGTGNPDIDVHVNTAYDDDGASTAISGPNVGGGTTVKHKGREAERMGWYEFDGYALTLKFDNGKIQRLPTFFTGDDEYSIWFEGSSLSKDKDKKIPK